MVSTAEQAIAPPLDHGKVHIDIESTNHIGVGLRKVNSDSLFLLFTGISHVGRPRPPRIGGSLSDVNLGRPPSRGTPTLG